MIKGEWLKVIMLLNYFAISSKMSYILITYLSKPIYRINNLPCQLKKPITKRTEKKLPNKSRSKCVLYLSKIRKKNEAEK